MTTAAIERPQLAPSAPPPLPATAGPSWGKRAGFAGGIAAFIALALTPSALHEIAGAGHRPALAAATLALMAIWWLSEAVPIAWTASLPLALYPLCGVFEGGVLANVRASAEPFVDAYIFLLLGGMMIGAAMEQCGLHRRMALHIMRRVGTEPRRLLLGVLAATAAVSLWISNTATAVMMMPIAVALLVQLEASAGRPLARFGTALMLAVAYASNVGGIGTKIGTGTNSIFCGFVERTLGLEIGFMRYIAFGLPFVVLFIPLVWAVLWRLGHRDAPQGGQGREVLERELASMGPMSGREKAVLGVFLAAAALWVGSDILRDGARSAWPGLKLAGKHAEAAVGMAAGLALVASGLLSLKSLRRMPWGTLVLLGGSLAMAAGIEGSRLSDWMSARLAGLAALPLVAQIGLAALATVGLSAVASNVGTVSVLLNVLPASPAVLSASAIGASCDFMLPAGTPPNAIVFGSGRVRLPDMMKAGFLLDLAAAGLATAYVFLYARHLF